MNKKITTTQIKKNIIISVAAQIISLAVSFLMNLILPKYISEYQYAYWQTFLLYVGYVGILHFGLLDGIVLRYSQYDYDELDKPRVRSQFLFLLSLTSLFAVLGMLASLRFFSAEMKLVFILTSIGIITKNLFTYSSYLLQVTNRISGYAKLIILNRLLYGALVILLLILRVQDFYWFCSAELLADIFGVIVASRQNRGLYFGKHIHLSDAFPEFRANVSAGIMLMLANWSSFLLTGSARLIVQWRWDELTFGKMSFSFSVTNLFLNFVSAISVVLFPSLKRTSEDKLPELYIQIRNSISPFLIFILILYYPGCLILHQWLPNYDISLKYLGILLPIIIFTSKASLLTNNYLKAYRKEKRLLFINIISVVAAFLLFLICAYGFSNLNMLLICIVLVLAFRCILSELEVMKLIGRKDYRQFTEELIMSVVFILSAVLLKPFLGFVVYLAALMVYSIFNRRNIASLLKSIVSRVRH